MSKTLSEQLRIKAGVMQMGEKIAWGSDTALMEQAADEIDRLKAELAEAKKVPEGMSLVRLTDIVDAKHYLEKATEWNGQGWNYNLLHPMFYRPAIELLDEMMADAMLAARSNENEC